MLLLTDAALTKFYRRRDFILREMVPRAYRAVHGLNLAFWYLAAILTLASRQSFIAAEISFARERVPCLLGRVSLNLAFWRCELDQLYSPWDPI